MMRIPERYQWFHIVAWTLIGAIASQGDLIVILVCFAIFSTVAFVGANMGRWSW